MPMRHPQILVPLMRQDHLDHAARERLWHAVRSELLAALDAHAASARHASGGRLIGLSEEWEIVLSGSRGVELYQRASRNLGQPRTTIAAITLRKLRDLARLRPAVIGRPREAV